MINNKVMKIIMISKSKRKRKRINGEIFCKKIKTKKNKL